MLIYNTTFQVDEDVHDNFMIWIKESYIPEVQKHGALKAPRICRILSHREEGSAYSLQWEVESSGLLHRWVYQINGSCPLFCFLVDDAAFFYVMCHVGNVYTYFPQSVL